MNLRRLSTAGSMSGPPLNSSSSMLQDERAGAALLLRELAQVAVAGVAQHLEALFLDRLRQRANAQTRGVLGAEVLVDDDDREVKSLHALRLWCATCRPRKDAQCRAAPPPAATSAPGAWLHCAPKAKGDHGHEPGNVVVGGCRCAGRGGVDAGQLLPADAGVGLCGRRACRPCRHRPDNPGGAGRTGRQRCHRRLACEARQSAALDAGRSQPRCQPRHR